MIRHAFASLTPALLLGVACLRGGLWPWLAVGCITVVVFGLDRWVPVRAGPREDRAAVAAGRALNLALAAAHLLLLPLGVWRLAQPETGSVEAIGLYLGLSLFLGQVSNANAHELIHARSRPLRALGALIHVSLLFGHHVSAHLRVHHIHVATPADPNSARPGESIYRFWPRAWIGSFRAGLAAERARSARTGAINPYVFYVAGAGLFLAIALVLAGWRGLVAYVLVCAYAQMQLLMSDYVQHYGLRRARRPDGSVEPQGPQHSWNAPHGWSAAMMLNAPRHSDHHLNAGRPFPALRLDARMPVLPYPLPFMVLLSLAPPLWRRIMHPRLPARPAAAAR